MLDTASTPAGAIHGTVLGLRVGTDLLANNGYLGSQPGIIRSALREVPDHQDAVFVDIGCGKGRALIVSSEFRFRSIIGIESTFAGNFPYDAAEVGYGLDSADAVIIWQDSLHAPTDSPRNTARRIVVKRYGWHAELAD